MSNKPIQRPKAIRCAVYTRKSTEEGLDQQYNSLDSQRDAGEACIRSQANEGWELVPDRYDDGGFSGGNILYGDSVSRKDAGGNLVVDRVLRTKPHPTYEAGDRTGRLPEMLPLDYAAFNSAFSGTASNSTALSLAPGKGTAASTSTPGSTPAGKAIKQ